MLSRLGRLLGLCNDAVYGGSRRRWAGAAWRSVDALASRMVMTERASKADVAFEDIVRAYSTASVPECRQQIVAAPNSPAWRATNGR